MGQAIGFFGTVLAVVGLIHYYLWRRLVRATIRSPRVRRIGTWAIVALSLVMIAAFVGTRMFPHDVVVPVAWVGFLWLALMFYLLVALGALEVPALAARILLRRRARQRLVVPVPVLVGVPAGPAASGPDLAGPRAADLAQAGSGAADPDHGGPSEGGGSGKTGAYGDRFDRDRRLFLARAVAITAGLTAAGLVGTGTVTALQPPRLRRVQIPLARLPRSADRFRVALVSDIHLGPLRGASHTRRIVDIINGLDADIVSVVGDLVDGSVAELGAAAAPLRDIRSRHGAFFVTGNHEYYSGYEEWNAEVARLGLRPLRNDWLGLPAGLDLAGVNDVTGRGYGDGPDVDKALRGRDPSRPVIMLAHQPIQAHEVAARGVDLQLSGHTHGGQMVPFNVIVRLAQQPVVSGLGEVDGMPVYVTNGAGFWGPPVRVGALPDITLVEVRVP